MCIKALKRRKGPLLLHWDAKVYLARSDGNTTDAGDLSRSKALKVMSRDGAASRSWSRGDAQKFGQIIQDEWFWAYLDLRLWLIPVELRI